MTSEDLKQVGELIDEKLKPVFQQLALIRDRVENLENIQVAQKKEKEALKKRIAPKMAELNRLTNL